MTGVELIVAALAAGTSAGLAGTTTNAIEDAYTALKRLLSRRLSGRQAAVDALDAQETEPGAWRAHLDEDLVVSGAAMDEEILTAAQRLLFLVHPLVAQDGKYQIDLRQARGVQAGDHNTQNNTFS